MAAKLLSGYTTSLAGVVNFTDPNHPGYGFPYLILNGNDKGSFTWEDTVQGNVHRIMICIPWENIGTFRNYVLAGSEVVSGSVVRKVPMQSPFVAQFPNTYASRISGTGDGSDADVSETRLYADCILAVEFTTLIWSPDGSQPFIEVSYSGSADYDTIPDAKLEFAGNSEKIDHDAGVLVGQLAIQVTAHQIPDINAWIANLMPLKGKVNSADVVIDGFTYAPGYLLFPTFDASKTTDSGGVVTGEGTISLIQRDIPWNSGIRSDGSVDTIVVTGSSTHPYDDADLNGVFTA